jgi:type IX secretion system PorP/SprF family membrane protein
LVEQAKTIMGKVISSFILFFCCILPGWAQGPVYSQYILNEFLINPSVAGFDGMTTLNVSGRKQWVGFQNSPQTYSASVSTRILKSPFSIKDGKLKKGSGGRVGLGAAFISDRNGAIDRTSLQLSYAYHIFLENKQLSFGLSGIATQFRIDENLAGLKDPDGDRLNGVIGKSTYIPDAAVGVSLFTLKTQLGLSVSNLLQSPVKLGESYLDTKDIQQIRQYLLYGVYRFVLKSNPDWEVEPSAIIKGNEKLVFSADFTGRVIYQRMYWAGLSVRTSGEFVLLVGVKMNRIYFGYSYDYGFNAISKLTYGSHEVYMAVKLGDSVRRYRWLERY